MLHILTGILTRPFVARNVRHQATTQDIVPPFTEDKSCETGRYCIRATVHDMNGEALYKTYEGFSKDINIGERTEMACERRRFGGHVCTKPKVTMMGYVDQCNEHIIIKNLDGSFQVIM